MKTVTIHNLRRIGSLEFILPDVRGVYLLTGANGAGKSTLISCLAQIGGTGALSHFFQPNITFRDDDGTTENVLSESVIRYDAGLGNFVEYRFINGKWTVSDGREDIAFEAFGYAETLFAGAKPKRQSVEGELFDKSTIRPAPENVRRIVSEIFDDENFLQLSIIRSPVTGEDVFLRPITVNGKSYYFSENNFSSGERAVIKLATQLTQLSRGSLVLIDEAEMALHPKSQKRLLTALNSAAKSKDLLVIVSTQSASIIKITDPRKILFLENDEESAKPGALVCRRNVYPAAILGEMAFAEEILPETMLLVEDQEASMLLDAIVEKMKQIMPGQDFPYTKILPVGGYMQVVILMDNLSRVFPPYVHRRAVLDKDAENNVRRTAAEPGRAHHAVVARNIDRIYFLPCAPEQGVIRMLERDPKVHSAGLKKMFSAEAIDLRDVMLGDTEYIRVPGDSRGDCKDKLSIITAYLAAVTGEQELLIRKKLYRYYVENRYRNADELKQEYCPLIFRR